MNNKLKFFVSNAEKGAKNLIDNAIQAVDQNDNGKLDINDLSVIADSMGMAVKKGARIIKDNAEEKAKLLELKILQPIFSDSLNSTEFMITKFIRVADRDKRYSESEVCQGSIGFISNTKSFDYVNIFRDSIDFFGLSFYPDSDSEFYYIDPSDRDRYIALDEYFNYLKVARINELQKIAQDLGAKHFKVTYKEEQTAFSEKNIKANMKITPALSADINHESTEKKYSTIEVAAEMDFPGHAPIKPKLKYMQSDPSIQTLISMRMDKKAPILHQKFMIKLSNSSGIKETDAIKIDTVLKGMKYAGNTTVASEAKNESRRYLEYDISF